MQVYTTCPVAAAPGCTHVETIRRASAWAEAAGAVGSLVYTDNGLIDPWLAAQILIESTEALVPLVAVQPAYEHPFSTARTVASFQRLHGRRVDINLVAGGFVRDLEALGASLDHDERYARLAEFATIVGGLLAGDVVTLAGDHYRVDGLTLDVAGLATAETRFLVSGSSPAGIATAQRLGALPVRYPGPPGADDDLGLGDLATGVRLGIICRDTGDEAWAVANQRFPPDRAGEMKHALAVKVSDSHWHARQSTLAGDTFWLHPVNTYKSFCPYLVGTQGEVADVIGRYLDGGVTTLIVDIPESEADLAGAMAAVDLAVGGRR